MRFSTFFLVLPIASLLAACADSPIDRALVRNGEWALTDPDWSRARHMPGDIKQNPRLDGHIGRTCDETRQAFDDFASGSALYRGAIAAGSPMPRHLDAVSNLACTGQHQFFSEALALTGFDQVLRSGPRFTIIAPTDAAFRSLVGGRSPDFLLAPGQRGTLHDLIGYHIINGARLTNEMDRRSRTAGDGTGMITLSGDAITARHSTSGVMLRDEEGNRRPIALADIAVAGGVIHVTDHVLIPRR